MRISFCGMVYDCTKAIKNGDRAELYLSDGGKVEMVGVSDWSAFSIEGGEWSLQEPSTESILLEIAADHEERLCMMELGI